MGIIDLLWSFVRALLHYLRDAHSLVKKAIVKCLVQKSGNRLKCFSPHFYGETHLMGY